MYNCSFYNIDDDASINYKTDVLKISNINLDTNAEYYLDQITLRNVSMQFLTVSGISGAPSQLKTIEFNGISISDASFSTRNVFMSFGPIITTANVQFKIKDLSINNLQFTNGARLIEIVYQTPNPFVIEDSIFRDVIGGYVELFPKSSSSLTEHATLQVKNVTLVDNDSFDRTFFVLRRHSLLQVSD